MLDTNVQYVKGVGPRIAKALKKVNINTIEDLIYYFPRDYEDRTKITTLSKITIGSDCQVVGKIIQIIHERTRRNFSIIKVLISDKTGSIIASWFNQPYLEAFFRGKKGSDIFAAGRVDRNIYSGDIELNVRDYEIIEDDGDIAGIAPKYNLTEGLYQKKMRKIVKQVLDTDLKHIKDPIPTKIIAEQKLLDLSEAILILHFPKSMESVLPARNRLAFDDFFSFQLGMLLRRRIFVCYSSGATFSNYEQNLKNFEDNLPFCLTKSQKTAIDEIKGDLKSGKPMNRLLQGDVGSGKTVVAIEALIMAASSGYQCAIMAPTEILSYQHYIKLNEMLRSTGLKIKLLTSGIKGHEKSKIKEQISGHDADIVVGTHALIEGSVKFKKLGLCIIDEQHRFGVVQRTAFKLKGQMPHLLVMTATPIPRSLALTLYGDLDRTIIDEMPAGRKKILTKFVFEKNRPKVYDFIRNEIKSGRQVFFVCPLIEESEKTDLKAAAKTAEMFQNDIFPEFRSTLLHGKMKSAQKEKIMNEFRAGDIDILVSTTVIEVGIDIPNATVMVIEHAERFGLSQLHQLRGRIGRGKHQSYCILIGSPKTEDSKARLRAMVEHSDGFKIAEIDLGIRGPGDFYGIRQSGLPPFRVADIIKDEEILRRARNSAQQLVRDDPTLNSEDNLLIKRELFARYGKFLGLMSID